MSNIRVHRLSNEDVTQNIADDISHLCSQLSSANIRVSKSDLEEIVLCKANLFCSASDKLTNKVIGMACLVKMTLPQGKRWHIESFIVDQNHRKKNVGTSLMLTIVNELKSKNESYVNLTCNPMRKEALSFYKLHGFKAAETNVYRLNL
jgi:ribosomal protein S18 acetylase RimI-like enzyme